MERVWEGEERQGVEMVTGFCNMGAVVEKLYGWEQILL